MEYFDRIRRFELNSRLACTPVRNAVSGTGHIPKKELNIGDLVKVKIYKIIGEGGRFPKGFEAEIVDIQRYAYINQRKAPFIPRSLVSELFFNEITRALKNGGKFTTWGRIEKYREDHGNYILSLKGSPDAAPHVVKKPQIDKEPQEARRMSQTEIDLQNLKAGNYVPVKLISVEFEESEKGKPFFNALFTFDFHGEKAPAVLPFDDRRFSRGDLIRLADSHKVVPIKVRPLNGGKLDLESDGLNAVWEFNLQKVFYEAKELRRASEAYRHTKNFHS